MPAGPNAVASPISAAAAVMVIFIFPILPVARGIWKKRGDGRYPAQRTAGPLSPGVYGAAEVALAASIDLADLAVELCPKMGDDGFEKAAYRGWC